MTADDTPLASGGRGSHVLLRAFADELRRCGLAGVVTSPGSRGTPVLFALAGAGLELRSAVDERTAAFVALGWARASGRPVALACTSGTAAANYLPGVVEAHEARVPLLVLTADRPVELREVGAGQAIDQVRLYGRAVRWFQELAVDEATPATVRWMRSTACRAVQRSLGPTPGPVHLDLPLREPLVPPEDLPATPPGRADDEPWVRTSGAPAHAEPGDARRLAELLLRHPRAVVVAGRHERDPGLAPALAALCELLEVPLLADPLSLARRGDAAVAHYDLLLRAPDLAERLAPDLVVRIGDLPTSKPLRGWLATLGPDVPQVHVDAETTWQDPDGVLSDVLASAPLPLLQDVAPRLSAREPAPGWLAAWREADAAAATALEAALPRDALSEPGLARELVATLPHAATLLVASSMPIRDVELAAAPREGLRVVANRGANGIDGTIATAWGLAVGAPPAGPAGGDDARPPAVTCVLLGDVALRHDAGSLLEAGRAGVDLVVVVVDNGGGGIFHFLPVGAEPDATTEAHVMTPAAPDVPALAAAAGATYRTVEAPGDLVGALRVVTATRGLHVVHLRTERVANRALHAEIERAVVEAAGS